MLHIVLHQPEIPHNTGAVGRSCVAIGAKLWLVRPLGFRIDSRHIRRAGLDYWEHLNFEVVDDWPTLESRLSGQRLWFFSKRATRLYTDVEYQPGDALVFGDESKGLPEAFLRRHADWALRIPIRPQVRSLNLAVAASIAMFEAMRQRGFVQEP